MNYLLLMQVQVISASGDYNAFWGRKVREKKQNKEALYIC